MKLSYDFHIHTALSPCGDESMTPNNIVNMSLLNELDVIGIADHHSCRNVEAVMQVAEGTGLLVIPGMEVESNEEIHILCLFPDMESIRAMGEVVDRSRQGKVNDAALFGEQLVLDKDDEIVEKEGNLLTFATDMTMDTIIMTAYRLGGIAIPAHIDRPSYSLISNLGFIPPGLNIPTLEISQYASYDEYTKRYPNHLMTQSSDAHELGYIGVCGRTIEVDERTVGSVIALLRKGNS